MFWKLLSQETGNELENLNKAITKKHVENKVTYKRVIQSIYQDEYLIFRLYELARYGISYSKTSNVGNILMYSRRRRRENEYYPAYTLVSTWNGRGSNKLNIIWHLLWRLWSWKKKMKIGGSKKIESSITTLQKLRIWLLRMYLFLMKVWADSSLCMHFFLFVLLSINILIHFITLTEPQKQVDCQIYCMFAVSQIH